MGKITVSEFLTLDGVMESSEQWQPSYVSDDGAKYIQAQIHGLDAMLFGRVTYEMFAAYWPLQTNNEFGIADKLNSMPKYVVSTTLEKADWNNSMLIQVDAIRGLKKQHSGNIGLMGSATLVQSLMQTELIDEYRLLVHPLIRGRGKRLFNEGLDTVSLKLVEARSFSSGVVLSVYQPVRGK